jgi:hypothetical protein
MVDVQTRIMLLESLSRKCCVGKCVLIRKYVCPNKQFVVLVKLLPQIFQNEAGMLVGCPCRRNKFITSNSSLPKNK